MIAPLALLACAPDAGIPVAPAPVAPTSPSGTSPTPTGTTGGATTIPIDTVGDRWVAAPGWGLNAASAVVGDVNDDGVLDARVDVYALDGSEARSLVLHGPLRGARVLPGDEDVSFVGRNVAAVGDATGDGVLDFVLHPTEDAALTLVAGPVSGVVDAAAVGVEIAPDVPTTGVADLDGDGVLDMYNHGTRYEVPPYYGSGFPAQYVPDDRIEVTWGPSSRWEAVPPDLIVAPECRGTSYDDWDDRAPRGYPDLTGDGVRELWVAGYLPFDACTTGYLLPLAAGGEIEPESDPAVVHGVQPTFTVVPDQTGDLVPDVLLAAEKRVLGAPVTFAAGGGPSSTTELAADPSLTRLLSLPFDLDADGVADFLGVTTEEVAGTGEGRAWETEVSVVSGGTLTDAADGRVWSLGGGAVLEHGWVAFLEHGVGVVLVEVDGEVVPLELGAAAAP